MLFLKKSMVKYSLMEYIEDRLIQQAISDGKKLVTDAETLITRKLRE